MKLEKGKEIDLLPQKKQCGEAKTQQLSRGAQLPSSLGFACLEPFLQTILAQSRWEPEPSPEGLPEFLFLVF